MRIAHFAPFAPHACGLYEAARDFVHADILAGHDAILVDTGPVVGGVRQPNQAGKTDERLGFILEVHRYQDALEADVLVMHDGIGNDFLAQVQSPIVLVAHGRPDECFRPEYKRRGPDAYSFIANVAKWPRVKKVVTMWDIHEPFWRPIVPNEKIAVVAPPPIDEVQFSPDGPVHLIPPNVRGEFNLLIADSWREVDPYEVLHGAFLAGERMAGLKVHVYGVEQLPDKTLGTWEHLFAHMRTLGIQGEVWTRVPDMASVYRSMDCLLTPHSIVTRVVGEALSCGIPVIAGPACEDAQWRVHPGDPDEVAGAIVEASKSREHVKTNRFDLKPFGLKMSAVYKEAVACP
jgi:glycosyltransferase involved in cell wall biosynthesis